MDEKANIFKVRNLYGKCRRIYGRHKREGRSALPGEICQSAARLLRSRGRGMDWQESAEAR